MCRPQDLCMSYLILLPSQLCALQIVSNRMQVVLSIVTFLLFLPRVASRGSTKHDLLTRNLLVVECLWALQWHEIGKQLLQHQEGVFFFLRMHYTDAAHESKGEPIHIYISGANFIATGKISPRGMIRGYFPMDQNSRCHIEHESIMIMMNQADVHRDCMVWRIWRVDVGGERRKTQTISHQELLNLGHLPWFVLRCRLFVNGSWIWAKDMAQMVTSSQVSRVMFSWHPID